MPGIFPRLSESGRRATAIAAAALGGVAVLYAAWRRDFAAAAIIGLTLAVLLGAYVWSRGGDDEDDQPRA